ncbi:MAG TPA: DUF4861 family protein [Verrucomicrobiae bacterium]|nr:DUF4861 family protein [Verrucomicrobiae bacterium]
MKTNNCSLIFCGVLALPVIAQAAPLTVTAVNKLNLARASQTIELTGEQLGPLGARDLNTVHVKDASGKELLVQALDTDGDTYRRPDRVIFQADFAPNESKTFTVTAGAKQVYSKDQYKAFGRFNRERFDDFVWENDRIAHRTYGKALETWEGEPLSSSTIDIWSKRTPRMVVNDWYLTDDYHTDHGDGADFYSAGLSRGCGGNGLWAADRLWTSRNFVNSRVLANGPIRVMFELEYAPFDVNGISVSEVKRISLDAGSQLDRFQSTYKQFTRPGQSQKLTMGVGLKKVAGEKVDAGAAHGWLAKWEKVEKNAGEQGLAVIVDPRSFEKQTDDKLNQLMLAQVPDNGVAAYWAGFCWDKAGQITTADAWKKYVDEFAQGLQSPIQVTVAEARQ